MGGYWEFPGGKLEAGETLVQCLKRELSEELSLIVRQAQYFGVHLHSESGKPDIRLHAYRVDDWSGSISLREHDDMQWLAPQELDRLTWCAADIPFMQQLQSSV